MMLTAWAYITDAWEWARTRAWVGWAVCVLVLFGWFWTLNSAKKDLKAYQDAQAASQEAQMEQKATAHASVRIKITPAPDGVASNSSWPAEIVVEADSSAIATHTEAPIMPIDRPVNGLSLGVGYFGTPYGYVGLKMGKVSVNLQAAAGNQLGAGADYQLLSW